MVSGDLHHELWGGDDRQRRPGFVVMPVQGGDWITCKLARCGFHDAPPTHNDAFVKVSRQEARRARAERTVAYVSPKKASEGHRWQKGEKAERMLSEDVLGGANVKGMVVFVDLFGAVGDRAAAFYNIVRDRGVDANPMACFYSLEPREHFSVVAKTRTVEKAVNDFNTEKLSIAGYVPLPAIPPAWEGKARTMSTRSGRWRSL